MTNYITILKDIFKNIAIEVPVFILVIFIGGLENWGLISSIYDGKGVIILFIIFCLDYELFLNYTKEKNNRLFIENKNKTKKPLKSMAPPRWVPPRKAVGDYAVVLSDFSRINNFIPWFIRSIKVGILIFALGYLYNEYLIPGISYCNTIDEDFKFAVLFIILISLPQILLIGYFLNKSSVIEKLYLLASLITLRTILTGIILAFISVYNKELSEYLLVILSTGLFSAVCELGLFDNMLITFKNLINIPSNLYEIFNIFIKNYINIPNIYEIFNKFIKGLIYYRGLNLKHRMPAIIGRLPLPSYYSTYIKKEVYLPKFLRDSSHFPSQFQSYTMPKVLKKIFFLNIHLFFCPFGLGPGLGPVPSPGPKGCKKRKGSSYVYSGINC